MALTVYTLRTCDTCRSAVKWLRAQGIEFEEKPIRETPPSTAELNQMLAAKGGAVRRLFNASGREYREQKMGERLDRMDAQTAIALLAGNGSLVKRPFVIGPGIAWVGFDPDAWRASLSGRNL